MNEVDAYIDAQQEEIQPILSQVRNIIRTCAPDARETISYGMPGYRLGGKPLVYFAAQKRHLGLYATPSAHEAFKERLSAYKQGKGSVQFPYSQPIPYDLITEIVAFRVEENRKTSGK